MRGLLRDWLYIYVIENSIEDNRSFLRRNRRVYIIYIIYIKSNLLIKSRYQAHSLLLVVPTTLQVSQSRWPHPRGNIFTRKRANFPQFDWIYLWSYSMAMADMVDRRYVLRPGMDLELEGCRAGHRKI